MLLLTKNDQRVPNFRFAAKLWDPTVSSIKIMGLRLLHLRVQLGVWGLLFTVGDTFFDPIGFEYVLGWWLRDVVWTEFSQSDWMVLLVASPKQLLWGTRTYYVMTINSIIIQYLFTRLSTHRTLRNLIKKKNRTLRKMLYPILYDACKFCWFFI